MISNTRPTLLIIIIILLLGLASCNMPAQTGPTSAQPSPSTPAGVTPVLAEPPAPTTEAATATHPPVPVEPTASLAFLQSGDVFRVDLPGGAPRNLTNSGGVLSFAWAPDGASLAVFKGNNLCFITADGAASEPCLDLGLPAEFNQVLRRVAWAPDGQHIVLWNATNPWDEGAIGWLVIDAARQIIRIDDPVDWGLALPPANDPGGITGQALFLPDGTLLGTFTHRAYCGSGGCSYQIYSFDVQQPGLFPYHVAPTDPFQAGEYLALASGGQVLANVATRHAGCATYSTYVDLYTVSDWSKTSLRFDQETFTGLALSPDGRQAIVARGPGCSSENQTLWAIYCGLSDSFDVYNLQAWNLAANQRRDLLPGLDPAWSSSGELVAFRSCLSQDAAGAWQPEDDGPPAIFVMAPDGSQVERIAAGSDPAWRP